MSYSASVEDISSNLWKIAGVLNVDVDITQVNTDVVECPLHIHNITRAHGNTKTRIIQH